MNIAFITNGNSEIGFGHVSRTLILYSYFKENGHKVKIIVPESCTFKSNEDFIVVKTFDLHSLNFLEKEFNIVIIDSIEDDYDSLSWLGSSRLYIVTMTLFFFDVSKRYEHISFFPSIQQSEIIETEKTQIFTGNKYLTFREEFENADYVVRERANKVLITMGGTDPYGLTLKALESLMIDDSLSVTVLLSEKSNDFKKLVRIAEPCSHINVCGFTDNIVNLFKDNDLAIINGGLTRYETCVVGIPFIAISIHKQQYNITKEVTDLGAGINLGVYDELENSEILKTTKELLSNYEMRNKISSKMKELIDTKGIGRIYKIVCDKYINYEACYKMV